MVNFPSLAVDEVQTLSTTINFVPNHLFAAIDPNNVYDEIDESNNIAYEELPIVHGVPVTVVGETDPNLLDIIAEPASENESGGFDYSVQASFYDTSALGDLSNLCDISTLTDFMDLQGKIALVQKTDSCEFAVQVNNAATLGSVAVLIYNTADGGNQLEIMTGDQVYIPSGFLAYQDGFDLLPYTNQEINLPSKINAITILDPYN